MKGVRKVSNRRLDYVKESVVRKILADNDWLLMLGERSNGKSYCVKSLILKDCYKDDKEFIYLRRYDIDVKDSQCVLYFGDCPVEAITDGEYSCIDVYRKAIYFANVDQDTGKVIRGKKIGYCQALSASEHYKSFAFPKVEYILFEEYIAQDGRYLYLEPNKLQNHCSTVFRHRKGHVIMIGNTLSRVVPYYREWQLHRTARQKLGTVDQYIFHNDNGDDTRLAVYLTDSLNFNSGMFFGTSSKSITQGCYEVQEHPHLPKNVTKYDIIYTCVIEYNEFKFLCQLMQDKDQKDNITWYVQPKTSEIKERTRVISNQFSTDPWYTSTLRQTLSDNENRVFTLFRNGKVCFSDNLTGTEFNTILQHVS